jgi:phosphatidylglycerol:prolipoprotein diacylglycerol transferase
LHGTPRRPPARVRAVAHGVLEVACMLPVLHARLGHLHLAVSLYAVCVALGVAAGFVVALRRAKEPDAVLVVGSIAVVVGMLGAEAWHRVAHAGPGLSSMGGIAAALIAVVLASKTLRTDLRTTLDALAPGALLGFAIGRVGCWCAGCCQGVVTRVPWGVIVAELGAAPRHPVQLYEAAADALLALWVVRGPVAAGMATARATIGYGLARIVLETWRDPAGIDLLAPGLPSVVQCFGSMLVVAGVVLLRARPSRSGAKPGRGRDASR